MFDHMSLLYLANSLAWSTAGFLLGVCVGLLLHRRHRGAIAMPTSVPAWRLSIGVLLAILSLVGAGLAVGAQMEGDHRERCIEQWSAAYTQRTQILSEANQHREDALDALVRAIPTDSRALWETRLRAYLAASDAYGRAIASNEIPTPTLNC